MQSGIPSVPTSTGRKLRKDSKGIIDEEAEEESNCSNEGDSDYSGEDESDVEEELPKSLEEVYDMEGDEVSDKDNEDCSVALEDGESESREIDWYAIFGSDPDYDD